jgi:enterochelin esterase-like enzyme
MKRVFTVLVGLLAVLLLGGSYWVFGLGAAQPDGPVSTASDHNFETVTYDSVLLHQKRTFALYLPPSYGQEPGRRYPTVYLLHGGHGKASDWFLKASAIDIIDRLYRDHKLPESVIIAPDGNDRRGSSPFFDPDYVNGPNGPILKALGEELVQVVDKSYRTLPDRRFRALGGLSSGGWGAMNIGLHYPQTFSVLFSHSGYFTYRGTASHPANSPTSLVTHLPQAQLKTLAFYMDAGTEDGEYHEATQQFANQLQHLGVKVVMNTFPGGHGIVGKDVGWNYWHTHLADSLSFVGLQFQGAMDHA